MESININSNINLYYIPMTKLKTTTIDVYIHRDLNEEESSLNALLPVYFFIFSASAFASASPHI